MSDEEQGQTEVEDAPVLANPLAVGYGEANADEPPFPAQQHLDVTEDLGGEGTDPEAAAHADDYEHLEGVPQEGDDPYGAVAPEVEDADDGDDTSGGGPTAEEQAEAEAQARYDDAIARGLSDDEAREEGWPTPAPEHDAAVDAIEAWVTSHPESAQGYLDAEQAKTNPRSSLVKSLEATIAAK